MNGVMRVPPLNPVKYIVFFDQVGHSFEPGMHITVIVRRPPNRFSSIPEWYDYEMMSQRNTIRG